MCTTPRFPHLLQGTVEYTVTAFTINAEGTATPCGNLFATSELEFTELLESGKASLSRPVTQAAAAQASAAQAQAQAQAATQAAAAVLADDEESDDDVARMFEDDEGEADAFEAAPPAAAAAGLWEDTDEEESAGEFEAEAVPAASPGAQAAAEGGDAQLTVTDIFGPDTEDDTPALGESEAQDLFADSETDSDEESRQAPRPRPRPRTRSPPTRGMLRRAQGRAPAASEAGEQGWSDDQEPFDEDAMDVDGEGGKGNASGATTTGLADGSEYDRPEDMSAADIMRIVQLKFGDTSTSGAATRHHLRGTPGKEQKKRRGDGPEVKKKAVRCKLGRTRYNTVPGTHTTSLPRANPSGK